MLNHDQHFLLENKETRQLDRSMRPAYLFGLHLLQPSFPLRLLSFLLLKAFLLRRPLVRQVEAARHLLLDVHVGGGRLGQACGRATAWLTAWHAGTVRNGQRAGEGGTGVWSQAVGLAALSSLRAGRSGGGYSWAHTHIFL